MSEKELNTQEASEYLKKKHGLTLSPNYLRFLRASGGKYRPPYKSKLKFKKHRMNSRVTYSAEDLDAFALRSYSEERRGK